MPKAAEPLDWGIIQALYTKGDTAEDIARAIAGSDPTRQRKIAGRIRTQAARQQWRNRAQTLISQRKSPSSASIIQDNTNTAPEQAERILGHPGAKQDVAASCNRVEMVVNLLDAQKKRYLANGATLAGTVLERAAEQAESGALPVDPESLRAIGEALLPFHRIGRDVFGLGGERSPGPQVQVNIATLSDARDVQVVEVE